MEKILILAANPILTCLRRKTFVHIITIMIITFGGYQLLKPDVASADDVDTLQAFISIRRQIFLKYPPGLPSTFTAFPRSSSGSYEAAVLPLPTNGTRIALTSQFHNSIVPPFAVVGECSAIGISGTPEVVTTLNDTQYGYNTIFVDTAKVHPDHPVVICCPTGPDRMEINLADSSGKKLKVDPAIAFAPYPHVTIGVQITMIEEIVSADGKKTTQIVPDGFVLTAPTVYKTNGIEEIRMIIREGVGIMDFILMSPEKIDSQTTMSVKPLEPGNFKDLVVDISGIVAGNISQLITVERASTTPIKGDITGDGIGLAGAIAGLQVVAGITPAKPIILGADVNSNSRIGLEEVIYILQKAAELR